MRTDAKRSIEVFSAECDTGRRRLAEERVLVLPSCIPCRTLPALIEHCRQAGAKHSGLVFESFDTDGTGGTRLVVYRSERDKVALNRMVAKGAIPSPLDSAEGSVRSDAGEVPVLGGTACSATSDDVKTLQRNVKKFETRLEGFLGNDAEDFMWLPTDDDLLGGGITVSDVASPGRNDDGVGFRCTTLSRSATDMRLAHAKGDPTTSFDIVLSSIKLRRLLRDQQVAFERSAAAYAEQQEGGAGSCGAWPVPETTVHIKAVQQGSRERLVLQRRRVVPIDNLLDDPHDDRRVGGGKRRRDTSGGGHDTLSPFHSDGRQRELDNNLNDPLDLENGAGWALIDDRASDVGDDEEMDAKQRNRGQGEGLWSGQQPGGGGGMADFPHSSFAWYTPSIGVEGFNDAVDALGDARGALPIPHARRVNLVWVEPE